MPPVSVDDPVLGDLPKPQVIRHRGLGQIVLQPAIGFDQHFLHDIAHIDSPLDALIEPKLHHPPQRIAMPLHQAIDRLSIAPLGFGQQVLRFFHFGPHWRIIEGCSVW